MKKLMFAAMIVAFLLSSCKKENNYYYTIPENEGIVTIENGYGSVSLDNQNYYGGEFFRAQIKNLSNKRIVIDTIEFSISTNLSIELYVFNVDLQSFLRWSKIDFKEGVSSEFGANKLVFPANNLKILGQFISYPLPEVEESGNIDLIFSGNFQKWNHNFPYPFTYFYIEIKKISYKELETGKRKKVLKVPVKFELGCGVGK